MKFHVGDVVTHVATNTIYRITCEPTFTVLLEYCNEQFYEYIDGQGQRWIRCVSEMEDGRFIQSSN